MQSVPLGARSQRNKPNAEKPEAETFAEKNKLSAQEN